MLSGAGDQFTTQLMRWGDREIAAGDYVTLDRFETHSVVIEKIQCFCGLTITRTMEKHANNAKAIIEGVKDRREVGEDAGSTRRQDIDTR